MIQLVNVTKTGDKKLDNINLTINKGEVVSILGDESSGNKELIYVMATLDTISSGTINCNDKRTDWMSEKEKMDIRLQEYGIILKEKMLIDSLNVDDNTKLLQEMCVKEVDENYVNDIIKTLDIAHIKDKFPEDLSEIEYIKVTIATILLKKPNVVFAQNFVDDIDKNNADECIKLLIELSKKYEITLVYSTCKDELSKLADRVVNMSNGAAKVY